MLVTKAPLVCHTIGNIEDLRSSFNIRIEIHSPTYTNDIAVRRLYD
jgi:hypothetical protein